MTSLGQRPRHDGRASRAKSELEQPKGIVLNSHQEEVLRADKGFTILVVERTPECEGVAYGVKPEACATGIQHILEERVLNVIDPHASRAEHRKACLHEKDERGGVQQEERIDAVVRIVNLSIESRGYTLQQGIC